MIYKDPLWHFQPPAGLDKLLGRSLLHRPGGLQKRVDPDIMVGLYKPCP
jgi:hypothetical protein